VDRAVGVGVGVGASVGAGVGESTGAGEGPRPGDGAARGAGAACLDSTSFWMRVASSMCTEAELRRSTLETIVTM
jgi:hypothetical protein